MSKMISVASGFQYSVNIAYDLNNKEKIKNFIPTASSLSLLEEILLSTSPTSTERSRILIGAYGKGKSHIMLMILSVLMKKDSAAIKRMLSGIKDTRLYQSVQHYYEGDTKLLPVIISGSNTSLTQAFLLALQRTLSEYNLNDVMPETNYEAAVGTIQRWKEEFPKTYEQFGRLVSLPVDAFVDRLRSFDIGAYEEFEKVYPQITAGSVFNPFLGFDVVELYENAAKGLRKKGYSGIFVVYDEFSKYLEANIKTASVSDTKMLQDFAEKSNRSGSSQMHIMLISHKEIANYIDVLPKQKVDGWRGVSERFFHVRLSNNFTQTYEVIEKVIQKDKNAWKTFVSVYGKQFEALNKRYLSHPVFSGMDEKAIEGVIQGCYPLHPISTFVLPRLSERVAQNERTLFTFLSANGISTLPAYLESVDEQVFGLITPDLIYDYFEPLFRKEIYSGNLQETYKLTEQVLQEIDSNTLESKIVKCISLIYILEQFEKIKPTEAELQGIFSVGYSPEAIRAAVENLIEKKYVVYLKRSNGFLQLKQSSGVDIRQQISDMVEGERSSVSVEDALNEVNSEGYFYPARYNDEHEMIRYFAFRFVDSGKILDEGEMAAIIANADADGLVIGVLPKSQEAIEEVKDRIRSVSIEHEHVVFVIPNTNQEIESYVREYKAVMKLRDLAVGDTVLFNEYEAVYEDLRDLIVSFIASYSRPELCQSKYYLNGEEQERVNRRSALSEVLSEICDTVYWATPVINNEALNRTEATSISRNSRNKVVSALLRSELEPNLGLSGTGQEVSIMRSTLVRTGIIEEPEGVILINYRPEKNSLIANLLKEIEDFILEARDTGVQSFMVLYERLCTAERGIALRRELVPIYLAVVLQKYKKQVAISNRFGQVLLTSDTLMQINAAPEKYQIEYIDWDADKAEFVRRAEDLFSDFVINQEKQTGPYEYIIAAMKRWYVSLPKYAKEMKKNPDGKTVDRRYAAFVKYLSQNPSGYAFLFEKVPQAFEYSGFVVGVVENIATARHYYDNALSALRKQLIDETKKLFAESVVTVSLKQMSLTSIVRDWCEKQDAKVFEQLFSDGTDKCLALLKTISNDEETFIMRLAKAMTDLRIEDWNDSTLTRYIDRLTQCKSTAEAFVSKAELSSSCDENAYQITFATDGVNETKRFDRVDTSSRGKLLLNKIIADIDSFGQAISEAEKRQIVMDVLKKLC